MKQTCQLFTALSTLTADNSQQIHFGNAIEIHLSREAVDLLDGGRHLLPRGLIKIVHQSGEEHTVLSKVCQWEAEKAENVLNIETTKTPIDLFGP